MPTPSTKLGGNEEDREDDLFEDELPEEDAFGRVKYLDTCKQLGVSPVSQVLKFLEGDVMQVMHYGLNAKGAQALAAALRINQNLRVLRLTDNAIPDEGLKMLCEVIAENPRCSITELDLSANRMAGQGAKALTHALTCKSCSLRSLSLTNMHLADREGVVLAGALENNTTLRTLDMSANELGERSAAALGHMLMTNLSLTDLNLGWNKLRPKGLAHLAEGLKANTSLQALGLAWCGIGDAGAEAMGALLRVNQGLGDVELSGNGITCAGIRGLAQGIAESPTLAAVRLDSNDLREEGGQELLAAVERNKGLVVCQVDNTSMSETIRTAMAALLGPRKKLKDKLTAQHQHTQHMQQPQQQRG